MYRRSPTNNYWPLTTSRYVVEFWSIWGRIKLNTGPFRVGWCSCRLTSSRSNSFHEVVQVLLEGALLEVDLGSLWGRAGVALGPTWGRPAVDPGSMRAISSTTGAYRSIHGGGHTEVRSSGWVASACGPGVCGCDRAGSSISLSPASGHSWCTWSRRGSPAPGALQSKPSC